VPGNEAFAEIYETYARLMRLIAVRDFRVPYSDAEGIVHDIFMHYFSNPGVVRGELKPYFRGAVRNESLEYWRKRQREQSVFCDVEDVECESAGDETLMSDTIAVRLAVTETLARLRPRCRDALRCFHYEGKSMRVVAEELDVAPMYVRQLLHHCRKAARTINGIKPLWLARKSGISRQTLSRLRRGLGHGTPRTRRLLLAACTAMTRRPVTAFELFGDGD
jgi:RNA polymerase sigma factor (sigma-70 family)